MVSPLLLRKLEVQQALKAHGLSQASVAREAKVSRATVTDVLNENYPTATPVGQATRLRVLRLLARRTRRPELFPELDGLKSA